MKADVFLHIGLAKTGTTSIQTTLANARDRLGALNCVFPRAGTINLHGGHHCLAWSLAQNPQFAALCSGEPVASVRAELAEAPGATAILSSEEFSSLSYNAAAVRQLMSCFNGRDVAVVVYVREQVEWFNSFYAECLKELQETRAIGEFVSALADEPRYHYAHWLALWKQQAAGLVVRPFARANLHRGDAVCDFLNVCGLTEQALGYDPDASADKNSGLNAAQVAALLYVARRLKLTQASPQSLGPQGWLRAKRHIVRSVEQMDALAAPPFWGIGQERAAELRRTYQESNRDFFAANGLNPDVFSKAKSKPIKLVHPRDLGPATLRRIDVMIEQALALGESAQASGAA